MKDNLRKYIYIGIFLIFICLPRPIWFVASHFVDTENYSKRELAEKPELVWDSYKRYSKDYEKYFNDHEPFRNQLIAIDKLIEYELFPENMDGRVIAGKNGWLFFTGNTSIEDYEGTDRYSEEDMKAICDATQCVQDYITERDSEFCLMIVTNKERVYSENMPDRYKYCEYSRSDELADYLKDNGINVVHTDTALINSKSENQLYYAYDTHWNQVGAYVGIREVIDFFGKETIPLSDLNIASHPLKDDYHESADGDLAQMLNLRNWIFDFDLDYNIEEAYYPDWENICATQHFENENAIYDESILIFGDSFRMAAVPTLAMYFRDVYVYTREECTKSLLDEISPQYVVIEYGERKLNECVDINQMIAR